MKKRTILDEIKNLNSHKPKTTFKEMFDSIEDEPNYFDEEDFLRAQAAAQQDIGSDFKEFGTTPAEKGLNFQDMIDDLKRQNLSLPNDEKELEKIKQSGVVNPNKYLAKKQSKQFGAGSINESKDSMFIGLQKLKGILNHPEVEYMDFGYGTKEERVKAILEDGVLLEKGMPGLTHNNIFPYNYLMDQWGQIWYFDAKIKGNMGTEVVDFDFSDEEKARIQHEETPEDLAQGDFAAIASEDERELYEFSSDDEGHDLIGENIERVKDAEGNPITLRCRVEDQTTGSAGRVVRFGIDDNNKQTVHVDWIQDFGKTIPKSIVYPETIVVRDDTRTFVKEESVALSNPTLQKGQKIQFNTKDMSGLLGTINSIAKDGYEVILDKPYYNKSGNLIKIGLVPFENIIGMYFRDKFYTKDQYVQNFAEGAGHSHTVGRGQNAKPGNYPQTLKRVGLKENLNLAQPATEEKEVYLVVDNDFNRAHYKDLIGQTFDDAPGYAAVKVVKPSEISPVQEDYDYNGEEIDFQNKQELDGLNRINAEAESYIPEELKSFYVPGSMNVSPRAEDDSNQMYEYILKIKKQSDETPKDVINFIKQAEGVGYQGPGQSYKKVDVHLEYEKGTEKWIAKVLVDSGYDTLRENFGDDILSSLDFITLSNEDQYQAIGQIIKTYLDDNLDAHRRKLYDNWWEYWLPMKAKEDLDYINYRYYRIEKVSNKEHPEYGQTQVVIDHGNP